MWPVARFDDFRALLFGKGLRAGDGERGFGFGLGFLRLGAGQGEGVFAGQDGAIPAYSPDITKRVGELSSNAEQFWNGTAWISSTSTDGKSQWNGHQWVPKA